MGQPMTPVPIHPMRVADGVVRRRGCTWGGEDMVYSTRGVIRFAIACTTPS
jgi:hypothetical protein